MDTIRTLYEHELWRSSEGKKGKQANFANRPFLYHLDYSKRDLSMSIWSGCRLSGAWFEKSNLSLANFGGCDLQRANFKECDLSFANFCNADLSDATFEGAILDGITIDRRTRFDESLFEHMSGHARMEFHRRFEWLK